MSNKIERAKPQKLAKPKLIEESQRSEGFYEIIKDASWPYLATIGVAITIFSNLEGFFRLGKFARNIIASYDEIISTFWQTVFSVFSVEISESFALSLTGTLLAVSLGYSSLKEPRSKLGKRYQSWFVTIYQTEFMNDLDSKPIISGKRNYFYIPGVRYFVVQTSYIALISLLFFGLYYRFASKYENFEMINFILGCLVIALFVTFAFIRNIPAIRIRRMSDGEIQKIKRVYLPKMNMEDSPESSYNMRVLAPLISRLAAELFSRLTLRLFSIVILVMAFIILGWLSDIIERSEFL